MGFHREIRTRIDCDTCGDQWQTNLAIDVDPTFDSRARARRYLTCDLGWHITRTEMICADCNARRICAEYGHVMEEYAEDVWVCGTHVPAVRYCRRCDLHLSLEEADGIDHPERQPGLLTEGDQAILAGLERQLVEGAPRQNPRSELP